jgi:hypothetical protein
LRTGFSLPSAAASGAAAFRRPKKGTRVLKVDVLGLGVRRADRADSAVLVVLALVEAVVAVMDADVMEGEVCLWESEALFGAGVGSRCPPTGRREGSC